MRVLLSLLSVVSAVEWAGLFSLDGHTAYSWIAQAKDGNYGSAGDTTMKIAILKTTGGIESVEAAGKALMTGTATDVTVRTNVELGANKLYNLKFNVESYMSMYQIHLEEKGDYVIFCEHNPMEFEVDTHYLQTFKKESIEPSATENMAGADGHDHGDHGAATGDKHTMGEAVGASIVTAMMAFIGVLTLAPALQKCMQPSYAFAVASGVLLACALMLMWPESLHLIPVNMHSPKESEVSAVFAVAVLLGFVTTPTLSFLLRMVTGRDPDEAHGTGTEIKMKNVEGELAGTGAAYDATPKSVDWGLVLSMAFGDGFHNICDGVVIGIAFKLCDTTTAWTVAAGAIWHEAAQELSDFLVLTSAAGMSTAGALCVNFISALSCIIATIVIWNVELNMTATGFFLAYGGGTYAYLGTISTFSKLPKTQWLLHAILFILGTVSIGLVLIKHEHCSAGGGHEGHNH